MDQRELVEKVLLNSEGRRMNELTENAKRVLAARYLKRGPDGEVIENPDELFQRVARTVSQAELIHGSAAQARLWEERFYTMLAAMDFLPNSPTLMNAGTASGQLSACFVLPVDDSMESIFGTLRDMALVQRTGGGTGFSFSKLRPSGDLVASTGGRASGPVSFMRIYDAATENIRLGGRRRGANMGVLRVDHPDIEEFIHAKRDGRSLANFNLSVGVTDEFMSAVAGDAVYPLRHPADSRVVGERRARRIFDSICHAAWETGDPALIYLDTIERANPTPSLGRMESTNPCGELPLLPNESCNLGSINLPRFVRESDGRRSLDRDRLQAITRAAVRFLDDVITVNQYSIEAVSRMTLGNRKIGLGVMGFAELCILLDVSYASDKAVHLAGDLMRFIAAQARSASAELAEERGPFPNWQQSVHARTGRKLRNATLASIAPTGTISIIAGTSSSIEPLFALAYRRRNVLGGQSLVEFNTILLRNLQRRGLAQSELLDGLARAGRFTDAMEVPEPLRNLFVTALDIAPEHHVRVQAAFQDHVDNAVSKTVNLAHDATPEDVSRVYRLAHGLGCKGVTVFRYGSRTDQVLELGIDEPSYEREHFTRCDPGACKL
ncbi:MAG: ribonucleoside-diphosphate reductase, adenosylcobalamin-dependent [Betaproteobacteria bacterium RIFCSPLOWO2_02_FULL_65_24]|nr:MAG: ribonucleoside-diphosphate reductase, adenosylcobalamin-dependent [Betaproteobacteria bacterium RIFCSPLOWO2_02_FULL_65_24]